MSYDSAAIDPQTSDDSNVSRPALAYLGPVGTYSHQAAHDRFAETVHYQSQDTISDVFHSENSIFGIVTETYDLLRSSELGESKWIRGTVTLSVQHCLLVRRGKTMQDIKRSSALGQCSHFLATNLPTARLVKVSSTAAAAEAVSMQAGDEAADSAAICSKICLQLFGNLEMLQEGIQDSHHNFTRFYILANHPSSPLPNTRSNGRGECNALVRLEGARVTVSDLLAALRLPVVRMDRRPSITVPHERFGSVYLVEVMDDERSDGFRPSECGGEVGTTSLPSWKDRVLGAIARVVESGGRATLLGTW
ncbi:Prephenate dehydratase-domain-containing protein [Russula vinacea]|nr:Prephenate dehydratase-domain-containing protein [Russula vinacea]